MSAAAGVVLSPIQEEMHFPVYLDNRMDLLSSKSILLYLSVAGSMILIPVLESESISSVKLRIQTCKGFIVKVQKLVFGGREFVRNESFVKNKDYSVTGGDVLLLALKLSDLLAINIITACREEFEVQVDKYRNVGYLKQRIYKDGEGFVDLNDQELRGDGEKLDEQRLIDDITKDNDGAIHLLVKNPATVRATPIGKDVELSVVVSDICERIGDEEENEEASNEFHVLERKPADTGFWLEPVIINPKTIIPSAIWDLIRATFDGLAKGNQPIRSTEGTGGTYFMRDASGHKIVAVFKPMDEEPMAVNNPGGLPTSGNGEGLKKGTKVGEGALREVAAYILDHPRSGPRSSTGDHELIGFSGVPPTPMVRCLHKGFNHPQGYDGSPNNVKIGSLQMFMENDGNCEDIGPQAFRVEEVHKISILDIRLANADRHAGNILYRKDPKDGRIELIPIDHGYCIPDSFEDCTFDWLYWPQAQQPFSPETLNYINSLDAEEDLALLKFLGWEVPNECARVLRISTMLLKKGAERGLSPYAIGWVMCRELLNKESMIEEIVHEVEKSLPPSTSEEEFIEAVSNHMDIRLDELRKN